MILLDEPFGEALVPLMRGSSYFGRPLLPVSEDGRAALHVVMHTYLKKIRHGGSIIQKEDQ
jgi:hypothetical protein